MVSFARAIDGLVTVVTTKPTSTGTAQNIATGVAYQPFGPLKQLTYGSGLALTRTHDQNYWLTGTQASATGANRLDLTFSRNANGQLDTVTDNAATGRSAAYGYTDSGRLQYGVGPWGDHGYAYDEAGNRTDFRTDVGGVVSYEFAANSGSDNRVTLVADTNGNPLRNLQYRDGGDLYEDARVGGSTYQYYYSARKRLVAANKDGVDQAYYAYDWRNQRVARQILVPTYAATHYVYDQQGRLLAEHNGSTGAVIKQYIWLDDMPLAVIDKSSGAEVVYYIHTGQMDEPLVMTDASKAKVWDAYVEPFGRAQVFGTATANIDLRLPGQWAQLETGGLSQNWNRDYDPTLARYIQADPIGLEGGQNVYAYVDGRPTELSDPLGLADCTYSISAHTLVCTPNSGGPSRQLGPDGVFSGINNCTNNAACIKNGDQGPIVPGRYKMNEDTRPGHEHFWRLEPNFRIRGLEGILCEVGAKRCGFELHPGSVSLGCITTNKRNPNAMRQYMNIDKMLRNDLGNNNLLVTR